MQEIKTSGSKESVVELEHVRLSSDEFIKILGECCDHEQTFTLSVGDRIDDEVIREFDSVSDVQKNRALIKSPLEFAHQDTSVRIRKYGILITCRKNNTAFQETLVAHLSPHQSKFRLLGKMRFQLLIALSLAVISFWTFVKYDATYLAYESVFPLLGLGCLIVWGLSSIPTLRELLDTRVVFRERPSWWARNADSVTSGSIVALLGGGTGLALLDLFFGS